MSDRALLERLNRAPASGIALAAECGITRGAVWKRIQALRAAGIDVHATRAGYALAQPVELLDREKIIAALDRDAHQRLAGLVVEFEIDSTQARALASPTPTKGCAVWLAEQQSAGQGRRGRRWVSPLAAHLYMSLSRRFECGVAALSGLSLAVGVAVAETLRAEGFAQVGVKWPNDLLADDRKLGGILIQLRGDVQGPCEAVIGVGLNVAMPKAFAAQIDQPWCDLASLAPTRAVSRNQLAAAVIARLTLALAEFERDGFASFLPRWQALDALAGRAVRVIDGKQSHDGIALGIREDGALCVRLASGERYFHGGEVSVRGVSAHDKCGSHALHSAAAQRPSAMENTGGQGQ